MVIVRGRNYRPQDIEEAVEGCHEAVRPGCCAAFSTDANGGTTTTAAAAGECQGELLVVVAEVRNAEASWYRRLFHHHLPRWKKDEYTAICQAICRTVQTQVGLLVARVILLAPRTIPKTTSGFITRKRIKAELTDGQLKGIVFQYQNDHSASGSMQQQPHPASGGDDGGVCDTHEASAPSVPTDGGEVASVNVNQPH
ncbi:unnamed protein product [Vitrella brassicaformis CCMP3155]|uniref:AMP-binding enzyme C-terminal domain-containing protein n=2 Tax=Vitrella brassicaformis TaxID=1169539 RepID=A0A0G4EJT1_VITBC|nr:unnamed protein product [Vitrella brassicaformis CCMP3155]|eukprot:CEL96770.1 unnamed protein product [Vitrella brassicaformis CCMP3155]